MTVAPEGRRLLRVEARNAETPIEKKPSWLKNTARMGPEFQELRKKEESHPIEKTGGELRKLFAWQQQDSDYVDGSAAR